MQATAITSTITITKTAAPVSRPGSVDGLAPRSVDGLAPRSVDGLAPGLVGGLASGSVVNQAHLQIYNNFL